MQYLILLALIALVSILEKKRKGKKAAEQKRAPKPTGAPSTFTPEEWKAYRAEKMRAAMARDGAARPVNAPVKPAEPQVRPAQPTPSAPIARDTAVVEGEQYAEHDQHMKNIFAREQARQRDDADARERRIADRQRMRDAVVMSEILQKPVSLRRRGTYQ